VKVAAINNLIQEYKLGLITVDDTIVYKFFDEFHANKIKQLTNPEDLRFYQLIEQSGGTGMTLQQLKEQSKI
jgi:hypothetical protein